MSSSVVEKSWRTLRIRQSSTKIKKIRSLLSILDTRECEKTISRYYPFNRPWKKPVHFGQFPISKWMVLITPDWHPYYVPIPYMVTFSRISNAFLTCLSGSPHQNASRAAPPAATSTRQTCPGRRTPASRPTTSGCPPSSSSALGWLASRGCCGGATWSTAS